MCIHSIKIKRRKLLNKKHSSQTKNKHMKKLIVLTTCILLLASTSCKQGGSDGKSEPNLDGGPNDPACMAGNGYCVEAVVVVNCLPIRNAINTKTLGSYLTEENIGTLSQGDSIMKKYLQQVKEGTLYMKEEPMPKRKELTAFIIGDKNLSRKNFVTAVIAKQQ
jgi:hypothetical protein